MNGQTEKQTDGQIAEPADEKNIEQTGEQITEPSAEEIIKAKKRKRRRRRKKILKVAVVLMGAAAVYLSFYAYRLVTADARFLRDMSRGLSESWMLESGETELRNRDGEHNTEFVEIEYAAVSKYRNSRFKNNELQALAAQYIDSLEQCRSVAEEKDPDKDFDGFWKEFSQPYGERLTSVYQIYKGDYGLILDDENTSKEKGDLLAQGWILSKVGDIEFKRSENEDGVITYTAELKNDSGFDLEFLDLEVELYNGKGKLVESASAYAENIGKGDSVELVFYQSSDKKVTQYRIVSEICKVKSADSPAEGGGTEAQGSEETGTEKEESGSNEETGSD